ncbi:NADPH-dependent F420 reductase [Pleomorphomonas carboxyditropha]|uniref:NADPH-dependent F420 reductase n=1 Tax=Pleomorphomonas carboxyditropha TaxID=2023338 RepID=A0A2G9WRV4_9HYPH|nr:NAD(P)-binding domain-containing protein [Pleomorphomonas carboxyditropha]PIO97394.1 NADPH-dependent F420 reductase [Pleomorphomonas carboxyditropha]
MKVSVIGTGSMGRGFAARLVKAGHSVGLMGRDAAKAAEVAKAVGAAAVGARDAGKADAIVLAVPYDNAVAALKALGDLDGVPVIDITNPLTADYMGLTIGHTTSAAEEIAGAVPGALLVKGFNTVFAEVLASGRKAEGGRDVPAFLASDSADAKAVAADLARSMGFAVVDAGGLGNARYLEALAGLNIYLGYGAGLGTAITPVWLPLAA